MNEFTRRNAVLSAGVMGLAGLTEQIAVGQEQKDAKPAVEALAKQLKLTDEQYEKAGVIPNLQLAPVLISPPKTAKVKEAKLEPVVVEIKDGNNKRITYALQWTCPTDVINAFAIGGSPFIARRFTFSVVNISWQAGDGWPVYRQYCPRDDYHSGMWYKHAKVHQIVPSIKGQNYFVGCLSNAICESANSGQVCFAVNDGGGDYGDNRGTFDVLITNWS